MSFFIKRVCSVAVLTVAAFSSAKAVGAPAPIEYTDADFYVAPTQLDVNYNLVDDFGANGNDTSDDSDTLQRAINAISRKANGGTLLIPNGTYYFLGIQMKSNVHIRVESEVIIKPAWNGDGKNHRLFEVGVNNIVRNFSFQGLGNGFLVDFKDSRDKNLAVFKLGDVRNYKISNFTIDDNKTIFASILVDVTERNGRLHWSRNGIIERIKQNNALFGYGLIQTYGADNILFRNLHSEGGIALRMETDNLLMKNYKQGGIRNIFADNIRCSKGLAAVMFGPHFMKNGDVQVTNASSVSCGSAVRSDSGFVELFSPTDEVHTRQSWKQAVESKLGRGCAQTPYARGNGGTRWAARVTQNDACLDKAKLEYGIEPGSFGTVKVFDVTARFGYNADLKQDQLDYFSTSNPMCKRVCLPKKEQWSKQGQIYIGPSLAAVIDTTPEASKYYYDVRTFNVQRINFPVNSHEIINTNTESSRVCNYYGMSECSDSRWER